jgi:hypothetical protein
MIKNLFEVTIYHIFTFITCFLTLSLELLDWCSALAQRRREGGLAGAMAPQFPKTKKNYKVGKIKNFKKLKI